MRFVENGPEIPDRLIAARDRGEVVFLCGAGVSYPAGMPTFKGLTQQVLQELGTPEDAKSYQLFSKWLLPDADENSAPSFDGIFNQLYAEYPPAEVDYCVAKKLKKKPRANLDAHRCLLKLATGPDEKVRLITTNFDLLFEKAASSKCDLHIAPKLPDLGLDESFSGIVYLHGRLNYGIQRHEGRHGLVLSSSDFGRAYLSQGWATRFFRSLLKKYTVVLVGYSASDPPVKYLLQGLRDANGSTTGRLYAFDEGLHASVDAKWRDTGAIPISYVKSTDQHPELWETLREWSNQAENPSRWNREVLKLASQKPQDLLPLQRSWVCSLVRSNAGAKQFAAMDPPAPADWLCVFDKSIRLADKVSSVDNSETFDPWENFRLDEDVQPDPDAAGNAPDIGEDLLSQEISGLDSSTTRVAGYDFARTIPSPPRIFHLANWIGKQIQSPKVAWWASRYRSLHPTVLAQLEWYLFRGDMLTHDVGKKTWANLLDIFRAEPLDQHDGGWFDFERELAAFGWTGRSVELFREATQPKLTHSSLTRWSRFSPPSDDWADCEKGLLDFEVHFVQRHGQEETVPEEYLLEVYKAFRINIELAAKLLRQAGTWYWQSKSLYPDGHDSERHLDASDQYILWFVEYLEKVCAEHPEFLVEDIRTWPEDEEFFFDKLRLYVWAKPNLISPEHIGLGLMGLSDEAFWESNHRRELLFLIKEKWALIADEHRIQIEERVIAGVPLKTRESDEEDKRIKAITSASILDWMLLNGCRLQSSTMSALADLRKVDPRYRTEWASDAADNHEGRSGYVETITDPSAISDLPAADVLDAATELSGRNFTDFTELKPFAGLIEKKPLKAIAALNLAARSGNFPAQHWRTAISSFPKEASLRLTRLFAARIAKLPDELALELRHELSRFAQERFEPLFRENAELTFELYDEFVGKLTRHGEGATQSALGGMSIGGRNQNRSRRTTEYAINSPIGRVTDLLFSYLNGLKLGENSGIPDTVKAKLERLFASPGEGSDHAVCVTTRRLSWLFYLDPIWVKQRLIPWFTLAHPASEPAWNGFLRSNRLPSPQLFKVLKPSFLDAAVTVHRWRWDGSMATKIHEFLVLACFRQGSAKAYVKFSEARAVLQKTDDAGRSHSIWFLSRLVKDGEKWRTTGKPFLDKAWPRETVCQTAETSQRFVSLAEDATDNFDEVVCAILPFLVPIKKSDNYFFKLRKDEMSIPERFPEATLSLLDRIIPSEIEFAPYDLQSLASVLEVIATAMPKLRQQNRWRRLQRFSTEL